MTIPKPMRILGALTLCIIVFLFMQVFRAEPAAIEMPGSEKKGSKGNENTLKQWTHDPQEDASGEPPAPLRRVEGNNYAPNNPQSERINATILSLVRNEELQGMLQSMWDLERTWNHKFNYPWTFFNDVEFTEEFKRRTSAATKAQTSYHLIPKEHWDIPSWINMDLYRESVSLLTEQSVQYMGKTSYHQMCRWNSGLFSQHPALATTQYYWRVEPSVHFFCDVDYDVFRWMQDHNKTYGFNINIYDSAESVATLWPETLKFIQDHPEHVAEGNAREWLEDGTHRPDNKKTANGYSTCHFWSNFEVGDLEFWRSQKYRDYFEHLDRSGGFFYERWGDAPVHSVALGLFEDKTKIHWFRDIGYQHVPFFNCPNNPKCHDCKPGRFTDGEAWLKREDCRPVWFKHVGMD